MKYLLTPTVLLLAPLAALLIASVTTDAADQRPNILHILADDLGWTALSCYGNKDVATPNLDRLAAQGMRFTEAYADAQCSPTRAAFLSGQYGARSGVFKVIGEQEPPKAFQRIPTPNLAMYPEVATLATTLRQAGYTTGLSGKWHIASSHLAAALRGNEGGNYFHRYGFDFCGAATESQHSEDKAVTAITDDIIGFIEQSKDRPWFAYAAHFTTHTKLAAPKALVDKHVARGYNRTTALAAKYSERPTAEYLAMLEHLDNEVGRLLAKLDELKLSDRTVVIFTSDNGGLSRMASCTPLREGKGSPYEGGIRVPIIVRWSGKVKPGSQCNAPVHTVDYYPTFASLAGAKPPANQKLDGEDLVPLWQQTGALKRNALFWHMPTYTAMYGKTPCAVIRQGDWKLIHWFGDYLDPRGFTPDDLPYGKLVVGPRTELYNLRDDLSETRDLADTQPDKARELRAALDQWFADTGAGFPTKSPDFHEATWWVNNKSAPVSAKEPDIAKISAAEINKVQPPPELFLEMTDLFENGKGGYSMYHIPGIAVTAKGTVLAWCEARKSNSDWAVMDILLRRSTDNGLTFGEPKIIGHIEGPHTRNPVFQKGKMVTTDNPTYNNPVLIPDRDGSLHGLFCIEYNRAYYMRSDDDGMTWSEPVEITSTFEKFRADYD